MIMDKNKHVVAAANAHTNLNTWGAVVAILEGGLFYDVGDDPAIIEVINLANRQQQRWLKVYDTAKQKACNA